MTQRRGGDARGRGLQERQGEQRQLQRRQQHSRDGHGAHGRGSEEIRAQQVQPGARLQERVRHRRIVHALVRLPESLAHLHGIHGARGRPRRSANSRRATYERRRHDCNERELPAARRLDAGRRHLRAGGARHPAGLLGRRIRAVSAAAFKPKFLSAPRRWTSSAEIAEIIIPKTDTSGAKDAGVPAFIDSVLGATCTRRMRRNASPRASREFAAARTAAGKPFLEQDAGAARRVREAIARAGARRRAAIRSPSSSWRASSRCSGSSPRRWASPKIWSTLPSRRCTTAACRCRK